MSYRITHEGWYAIKQRNQTNNVKLETRHILAVDDVHISNLNSIALD